MSVQEISSLKMRSCAAFWPPHPTNRNSVWSRLKYDVASHFHATGVKYTDPGDEDVERSATIRKSAAKGAEWPMVS